MAIPATGSITLTPLDTGGAVLQLDSDPSSYKRDWPKTKSFFKGLGGASIEQDFGRFAGDCVLKLDWSAGQILNKATIQQLKAWEAAPGARFRFVDGEGNDFTVTINRVEEERAYGDLYHAAMEFQVREMSALLGEGYTGA